MRSYLDNNATTRLASEALTAMLPHLAEAYGNPSSMHALGNQAARAVGVARAQVRGLLGAALEEEIIFTSGGTEANTTAIMAGLADPARREIITSTVEHPSILALCGFLEQSAGVRVHRIGVDGQGRLDIDAYRAALGPQTALVSLMWANNETGTIFPIEGLAELAHQAGALFHTDAVQAAGKCPLDLAASGVDMASVSAHKLHGPKGVGALYLRKGTRFQPLLRGGKQERGRRAGTLNVPGIVGFGAAADLVSTHDFRKIATLRDRLEAGILSRIAGVQVLGDRLDRLGNTCALAFDFVEGEALVMLLDREGIAASSGSACASGAMEPSPVLRAMKLPFAALHGGLRLSLSCETTDAEVDHVLAVLPGIVEKLRALSPFGAGQPDFAGEAVR
ncbi:cysteine desulfurase NifS [Rhodobacter ferrooxidans]|uniref:Cysteine desulfurase n=1 Tax=Rhodobacter ferrooxidans TaxID=371731 RepID=C8S0S3_9RHOB|nr:cysteine desulfurase NifS [Rhodobacter sp. SW2]EEW25364.1 cysteine desulfurase NifS [Rhodobacter sp. SW2]